MDENTANLVQNFFDYKKKQIGININGTISYFMWPESDAQCLPIILNDWPTHNEVVNKWVKESDTMLMAGGNAGLYPYLYSHKFDTVFTFEPDGLNFECLTENCKGHRIIKFNAGLSDKNGFCGIQLAINNTGMHKLADMDSNNVFYKIFTMTIDSLNLENLDFIHLDTEGHELAIFKKAVKTIKKCRPKILSDLTVDEEKIKKFLFNLDYELVEEYGKEKTGMFIPKEKMDI